MPEQDVDPDVPDPALHYEETVEPQNPPNSVVRPRVRTAALVTFLGGIVLVFLLVGAVLLFWTLTDRPGTRSDNLRDPYAVGTMGEPESETLPGGRSPLPHFPDTNSELEFKGVNQPTSGPMPGLTAEEGTEKKTETK